MDFLVSPGQASAVPGCTTFDNIHAVRLIHCLTTLAEDIDAVFIFIDSEKAFDMVEWPFLWLTLSEMAFPQKFIKMIQSLYYKATAKIRVNHHLSEKIQIKRGIRQGCPASPLLYALSLEPIRHFLEITITWQNTDQENGEGEETGLPRSLWYPPEAPSNFAYADDLFIVTDSKRVTSILRSLQTYAKEKLQSGFKINFDKSVALYTNPDQLPSKEEEAILPCYAWESDEHGHIHLGIPIGGSDERKKATDVAMERIRKKIGQIAPTRLPLLEKARLLNSKVAGVIQFYAQAVIFDKNQIDTIERLLKMALWGPKNKVRNYIKGERLAMPVDQGGTGLLDIPKWINAFHRNQILRLHRATRRTEDLIYTEYSDKTLANIFNHVTSIIRILHTDTNAPGKGNFFWLGKSERQKITKFLPEYWKSVIQHFDDSWSGNHTNEKLIREGHLPLDRLISIEVVLTDFEHKREALAQSRPDLNLDYEFREHNVRKNWHTTTVKTLHDLQLPIPNHIEIQLNKETDSNITVAKELTTKQHYLMPLNVETPLNIKGGTKWFYNKMKVNQEKRSESSTSRKEWMEEYKNVDLHPGSDPMKQVMKSFRGRKSTNLKNHSWHLWQRRMGPCYFKCKWCNGKAPESHEEFFLHQTWTCTIFRQHWNNLRKYIGLRQINSLPEIVFGHTSEASKKIHKKIYIKALSLHAAMWQQNTTHLDYRKVITTQKHLANTLINKKKKAKQ